LLLHLFVLCLDSYHIALARLRQTKPRNSFSSIVEVIPTQRTTTAVAALEPPEQADRVKRVLASPTLLVRRLHVGTNDTIADSTLGLTFQCTLNIASESDQALD